MVFDPTASDFDETLFPQEDQQYIPHSEAEEAIPSNGHESRGLGFKMNTNVDSDYAGDNFTCRSRTGYITFLNNSPIYWYSKKQGGVE